MQTISTLLLATTGLLTGASALNIPRGKQAIVQITDGVTYDGCTYTVAGTGKFTERALYTFSSGTSLPAGLYASDYTVTDTEFNSNAPWNHRFQPNNVAVSGGYLNLLVPGGQNPSTDSEQAITSAEVSTTREDILYASVRTKAIFGDQAGTCAGAFFYQSDNAEIDIEFLSDPTSLSNTGTKPNPIWYTNQKATSSSPNTGTGVAGLANQTTALNEYRIDWIKGQTKFFVNNRQKIAYTQNVPTTAGSWIWNNWSNGDKGWSVGPPTTSNAFKIQQIDMYFNTTSSASKKC